MARHSYRTRIVLNKEDVSSDAAQKLGAIFNLSEVEVHLRVTADFYAGCYATELDPPDDAEAHIIELEVEDVIFCDLKLVMGDDKIQHYVGENVEGEVERVTITSELWDLMGSEAEKYFSKKWRWHEGEAWESYADACNDTPD